MYIHNFIHNEDWLLIALLTYTVFWDRTNAPHIRQLCYTSRNSTSMTSIAAELRLKVQVWNVYDSVIEWSGKNVLLIYATAMSLNLSATAAT